MGHHVWCGGDVDERLWGVSDTGILLLGLGEKAVTHLIVTYFFWLQVQRYLSLRTVGEAKKACLLHMITMASLIIMVGVL